MATVCGEDIAGLPQQTPPSLAILRTSGRCADEAPAAWLTGDALTALSFSTDEPGATNDTNSMPRARSLDCYTSDQKQSRVQEREQGHPGSQVICVGSRAIEVAASKEFLEAQLREATSFMAAQHDAAQKFFGVPQNASPHRSRTSTASGDGAMVRLHAEAEQLRSERGRLRAEVEELRGRLAEPEPARLNVPVGVPPSLAVPRKAASFSEETPNGNLGLFSNSRTVSSMGSPKSQATNGNAGTITSRRKSIRSETSQDDSLSTDSSTQGGTRFLTESIELGSRPMLLPTAEEMKEKVRSACFKPEIHVSQYYKDQGFVAKVARSAWFEHITHGVIVFNAFWIAYETDADFPNLLTDRPAHMQVIEHLLCLYFAVEWVFRFFGFKKKVFVFKDSWFMFDSCLALAMVTETWFMLVIILIFNMQDSVRDTSGARDFSVLRIFRLIRLTRLARIAKLLRAMPELMILLKGMAAGTRSVFFTFCLLLVIIYVFSIAFTQMLEGTASGAEYFDSVTMSMSTFMLHGCLLEDFPDVAKAVGQDNLGVALLLMLFVIIASLTVMNLLVGILVEVVGAVAAAETEEMTCNHVKAQMQNAISAIDGDSDNLIAEEEFNQILERPDVIRALKEIGVDVVALVSLSDVIFAEGKVLTFVDFMEVVMQFRGSNVATVKDVVDLRKLITNEVMNIQNLIQGRSPSNWAKPIQKISSMPHLTVFQATEPMDKVPTYGRKRTGGFKHSSTSLSR